MEVRELYPYFPYSYPPPGAYTISQKDQVTNGYPPLTPIPFANLYPWRPFFYSPPPRTEWTNELFPPVNSSSPQTYVKQWESPESPQEPWIQAYNQEINSKREGD